MPRRKNAAVMDKEEEQRAYQPSEDLLTIHEVARRLRVDDTTVRRWINNGVLDAVTLPHLGKRRGYRVKKTTLDNLLSSSTLSNVSAEG
ncbi:MAG TPA: helix-turn-helix domain-containing protein [Ktedonobacteraceae bacterium]|nr:helix-turn-helix domain-containing protein [Ktedonobacteraceae bacterium]